MQAFSRRQLSTGQPARLPAVLAAPRISFVPGLALLLALFLNLSGAMPAGAASTDEQIAAIKSQMNDAIFQVQHIVNQPVTQLKRVPGMEVAIYSPGWFHEGATKPDFNTVDVRKTQEFDYEGHQYVTSDLNPGVVFPGHELEFNSMTKYFITDRLVPKKKLTEAEMLEINRLYRIIGHCEQQLDELQNPEPPLAKVHRLVAAHKPVVVGFLAVLVVTLLWLRKRQSQSSED
jgi:hypothetical protein